MKLFGICHAQSARKHRRAGHQVQENGDGRFKWRLHPRTVIRMVNSGQLSPSVARRLYPDQKLVAARHSLSGVNPTAIIVDETHDVLKLSGRMVEVPAGVIVGEIHTPHRIEIPTEQGMVCISVGDRYWPKRRNQHSKPYRVLGFMAGTSDVMFCRWAEGEPVKTDSMPVQQFLSVIGKQIL
jgi:hypothetical protein